MSEDRGIVNVSEHRTAANKNPIRERLSHIIRFEPIIPMKLFSFQPIDPKVARLDEEPFEMILKMYQKNLKRQTQKVLISQRNLEIDMDILHSISLKNANKLVSRYQEIRKVQDHLNSVADIADEAKRARLQIENLKNILKRIQEFLPTSSRLSHPSMQSRFPKLSRLLNIVE